jgi:hypothetical protein
MLKKWCFNNRKRMKKCLLKSDVFNNGKYCLRNGVSAEGKMRKMLLKSGVSVMGKKWRKCC